MRSDDATQHAPLDRYVSTTAARWPRALTSREVLGTFVSIDVAGFSALTERLARSGREGAELVTGFVDECFDGLVAAMLDHGGDILRFGGDSLRVAFEGTESQRAARDAARAALTFVRDHNRAARARRTPTIRLRVGVQTGPWTAVMIGTRQRELAVFGPAVDGALHAERITRTGTIEFAPPLPGVFPETVTADDAPIGAAELLGAAVAATVGRDLASEHRQACVMFVHGLLPVRRADAITTLTSLGSAVSDVCDEFGLTWLNTDAITGGVQLTLAADLPRGEEFAVERAVRGARALVERLGTSVRVGINQCTVFAGEMGGQARRTYTIMGDGVNVTARLAAMARLGTVVVARDALDASTLIADGARTRTFTTRGRQTPVQAVRVDSLPLARRADQADLAFEGRRRELHDLIAVIESGRHGSGRTVTVTGPIGIGKSRLVHEAVAAVHAEHPEVRVLTVDGNPATADTTLVAAGTPLRTLADAASGSAPEHDASIPTVLVIDDAQWLDGRAIDALGVILRAAVDHPWSVVVVHRGDAMFATDSIIRLRPLSPAQTRRLVADALTSATDATVQLIADRAQGNPRLVAELVRSEPGTLPRTVEEALTRRLDRLPTGARAVLRDAAVLGPVIDLELLAHARGVAPTSSELDALRSVLIPVDDATLRFRDELVRATAYDTLARARRRALHAGAARHLRRVRPDDHAAIAHHSAAAGLDSLTWPAARAAASTAASVGSWDEALRFGELALDAGLRSSASDRSLHRVAVDLAAAAARAGHPDVAERALRRARRHSADDLTRADLYRAAADLFARNGRLTDARRQCRSARRLLTAAIGAGSASRRAQRIRVEVTLVESVVDWYEGRHHRSVDRLLPLLEDRVVGSDATLRAQVLLQLEQGLDSIGDPRAVQIGLDGLALCSELGDDYRFATLASNTGYSEYNRGHWREALRRFGAAEAAYRRSGHGTMCAVVANNRALILLDQHRTDDARRAFEGARRVFRAVGFDTGHAIVDMNLARVAAQGGRTDDARRLLRAARDRFTTIGTDAHEPELAQAETEILIAERRFDRALRSARRAARIATEHGAPEALMMMIERNRIEALFGLGRVESGRAACIELVEAARAAHSDHDELLARHLLAAADSHLGAAEHDIASARRVRGLVRRLGVRALPAVSFADGS